MGLEGCPFGHFLSWLTLRRCLVALTTAYSQANDPVRYYGGVMIRDPYNDP
ncbi:hypothetical protein RHGRI_011319 [Rhododendron griersonianum]|uniref:Uncharacterized protein n=1 Tax=Rhododendron griersonianum TaxID=479676 RepID=A0AAV6KLC5_9ERIC|nr:hypothetical protein RHGRI_011319 [Rhododendron griersonianum]